MAQIVCKNLAVGYGKTVVKSNINFNVEKGDYLCIIGENGCGKSTLMKTILGLESALNGKIVFSDDIKKNEIGYLPQQTQLQRDFPASVSEVVMSGFLNRNGLRLFYTKKQKAEFKKVMKNLNIEELEKRCYRELSGGQQQKVLLARALCATDKILLLDEPVAALDPKASEDFYNLLAKINSNGTTIIMISHDVNEAVKYATKILCLNSSCFFKSQKEYFEFIKGGEQNA